MVTVVDYGLGNLGSIANMLQRIGQPARVSAAPDEVAAADKLILPGVGHFDEGMKRLHERGLVAPLEAQRARGTLMLGICLGAQLMTRASDEGTRPGLGWLEADTVRFRSDGALKIPHMGWADVDATRASPLFPDAGEPARFYFVHSFHFACARAEDVAATASYGYSFAAAFARERLFGVQFHPEKSHRFGMRLLERFCRL
jgi:glutamine amidotransferase